jgi:hypothetical protein
MLLAAGGQKTSLQLPSWYPDYEWQSDRVGILNVIVMGMNDLEDFESDSARGPRPAGDSLSVLETVPNNVRIHDMPEVVPRAISSLILLRRNNIRPFTSETSLEDL